MSNENKGLFAEKVVAGTRTYFLEVQEAKDGTKYLVITESRQTGSSYDHSGVMIFEEHLEVFAQAFQKALQSLGRKTKTYDLHAIRQAYPKAYERWTTDEDEQLRVKYQQGASVGELANYFQRQPGAIRSRLAKLGLLPPQEVRR